MRKISLIRSEVETFSASADRFGKKVTLRLERKSMEWMMGLMFKFGNMEELVSDTCGGTLENAKKCLQLPELQLCIEFVEGLAYSQNVLCPLVKVYA